MNEDDLLWRLISRLYVQVIAKADSKAVAAAAHGCHGEDDRNEHQDEEEEDEDISDIDWECVSVESTHCTHTATVYRATTLRDEPNGMWPQACSVHASLSTQHSKQTCLQPSPPSSSSPITITSSISQCPDGTDIFYPSDCGCVAIINILVVDGYMCYVTETHPNPSIPVMPLPLCFPGLGSAK